MRRLGIALLLAALATGTTACGSGSDDGRVADSATDTPTYATGDGATDTPADEATATPTPEATTTPTPTPTASGDTASSGGVSTDGAGDGTPSSGGATVDGAAACQSGVLSASLDFGTGGGAAGSTTGNLVLRNTSSTACTLYGYPGVSFVDGSGNQLGAAAGRSGASARTVTVRAGDSAFAELKITNAGNYDAATCGPVTATGLRVYPPGEKAALFVERSTAACSKDASVLTVGPMSTDG